MNIGVFHVTTAYLERGGGQHSLATLVEGFIWNDSARDEVATGQRQPRTSISFKLHSIMPCIHTEVASADRLTCCSTQAESGRV